MVKIPVEAERAPDAESIERRTQFLHDLGLLIAQWNRVELCAEIAIRRITGISNIHCSIVFGGLQHKAKISILYALLREQGRGEVVSKFKAAMSYAKRNALMHSALGSEDDGTKFSFFYRSVDDRYRVVTHTFTGESFHDHVWRFCNMADEALLALDIDVDGPEFKQELLSYCKDARFDGLG